MCKYRQKECPGRGHMYKGPVVESSLAALALQESQWATCSGQETQMRSKGWQDHFTQDLTGHHQEAEFSVSTMETPCRKVPFSA